MCIPADSSCCACRAFPRKPCIIHACVWWNSFAAFRSSCCPFTRCIIRGFCKLSERSACSRNILYCSSSVAGDLRRSNPHSPIAATLPFAAIPVILSKSSSHPAEIFHGCIPTEHSVLYMTFVPTSAMCMFPSVFAECVCISISCIELWNRVVARAAPRMTAQYAARCQPHSFQRAVLAYGFEGIL